MTSPPDTLPPVPHDMTRRAADQWIRDALRQQRDDMEELRRELSTLHGELRGFTECMSSALPNKDPHAHLDAHEKLQLDLDERRRKEADGEKLKQDIVNGLIKSLFNAAIIFVGALIVLGAQSKLASFVGAAKSAPAPAEMKVPK